MNGSLVISYAYPLCAMISLFVLTVHFFSKRQLPVQRNRLFTAAILLACSDVILETFSAVVVNNSASVPPVLGHVVLMMFYILRLSFPILMIFHAISLTKDLKAKNLWMILLLVIPSAVLTLIILATPLTGSFFKYENEKYIKGDLYPILFAVTLFHDILPC